MNKLQQYKRIWKASEKGQSAKEIADKESMGANSVKYALQKMRSLGVEGAAMMKIKACAVCGAFSEWKYCGACQPTNRGRDYVRHMVRARDKFACKDCGKTVMPGEGRQHDVHHIHGECGKKSRGYDRIRDMPGLITVCHRCHYNRHDHSCRDKDGKYVAGKKKRISKRPSKAAAMAR